MKALAAYLVALTVTSRYQVMIRDVLIVRRIINRIEIMKLEWAESFDENDNSIWEANSNCVASEGDMPFQWRIKQKLQDNVRWYYDARDTDLGEGGNQWTSLKHAKAYVENISDGYGD